MSGVFWDTINGTDVLRRQKEQFYSNGLEYSTEIDVFLLLRFFGIFYLCLSVVFGDPALFFLGAALISVALVTRWFAIPRARQQHLELSAEQLALLKKEKGDYVSSRFRDIVLDWRKAQQPTSVEPQSPLRPRYLGMWDALTVLFVLVVAAVGTFTRGWLGTGAQIKSMPEVSSSYITSGDHNRQVAVVFVHGVFGSKEETWLNAESKVGFPELLATDPGFDSKVDVFVFEYFTPRFSLAPSIVDLSDQLRGALDDHQVFQRHREIVFLAHSMGGIIVRQFILSNQERIPKVRMIYFYATPTNGSDLAALARIASANPQLRGMTPIENNDFLQSIQSGWLNSSKAQAIPSYCGIEELATYGQIIVPRSSAASLCNRALDPFTANHIDIVKPQDRSDPRYSRFASALIKEVPSLVSPESDTISNFSIREQGEQPKQMPKRAAPSGAGAGNQQTTNQAPIAQSNSGGCNQLVVGGNNNTNNCVPPPRILTSDQQAVLAAAIGQLPDGVQVKIGSADSGESQNYADQIRKAFGIQRKVGTLFGWHPKGIYVGVSSRVDVAAMPAQKLASQMKQAGLNIVDVEEDPQHDHPGEIEVIVGEQ